MKPYLQKYDEELNRIRNRARLRQYALLVNEKISSRPERSGQSAGRDRKQDH